MSRRRYLSTDISLDRKVNDLATECGDFAALLYTWMIPHATDDATITADPDVLWALVTPRRRDKTEADIEAAIQGMVAAGLVEKKGETLFFRSESFYKYQTYISPDKRRSGKPSSAKRRKTPEKAVSLSLSPSLKRDMSEIIDYLNTKVGTRYRMGSTTSTSISARIKDGFTVDDFKQVIDKKNSAWKDDPKMVKYLRPSTLFGTRFDEYLNEPEVKAHDNLAGW